VQENGNIERRELCRMFDDLRLHRLDCSPKLVQRFIEGEFHRLDRDNSGSIEAAEFAKYVAQMPRWQRTELLAVCNESEVQTWLDLTWLDLTWFDLA
jgi:Ca2+-binding EF-hand superfamily protein